MGYTAVFQVLACIAKHHALYKHVRAQLSNSRFSVTTTDSQDFKHPYAYNLTTTEHYRCSYVNLNFTDTTLSHNALHCKNLENRSNTGEIEHKSF